MSRSLNTNDSVTCACSNINTKLAAQNSLDLLPFWPYNRMVYDVGARHVVPDVMPVDVFLGAGFVCQAQYLWQQK